MNYDDIINLPHPVSRNHPQMPLSDRAAQFAPFAALSGYEDAIAETGRLTDERIEQDEDRQQELDEIISGIIYGSDFDKEVSITYFVSDNKKTGGEYVTTTDKIKKISQIDKSIALKNGKNIPFNNIIDIKITE